MPLRLRLILLTLVCALALAAPAGASTGACFAGAPGGPCHFETGKVVSYGDGDTIAVDLDRERGHRSRSVRLRAINAMELHVYSHTPSRRRGECHGVEAANRLERLIRAAGGRVRLSAQQPIADARGRLLRWVAIRRNGRWEDTGSILMREGLAVWMDSTTDIAYNARYNALGQQAAAARRGLFNPTHCGVGPQQGVPIKVWVNSDPTGFDSPATEWMKIQNRGATTLHLGGWWMRDSMLRRFTFPAGTAVPPGATVTVHVGSGVSNGLDFYWGQPKTVFENGVDTVRHLGDGGYLFDPQGDLRAWTLYPCVVNCGDAYQGALALTAHPSRPESFTVSNVSGAPVDLYGYGLSTPGNTYPFAEGTVLAPGQRLTVYTQGDPRDDTAQTRSWGIDHYILPDGGGRGRLITFTDVTIACAAWGSASCG